MGVFVSMYDHREEIAVEVRTDLQENLGATLFETVVVRDPQFIEAASHGVTLFDYNPLAKGARCYASLAREVMAFWKTRST
jgi:chromosome partitioning protein